MILLDIPTRNSLQEVPKAIVNLLDDPSNDDDNACNTNTTMMLHPAILDGKAAPLPY